ncbi:hypothetical protein PUN28_016506 [Cardiocondyla obscurior]|uniref:Ribosomal protein S4 n=1 Tax=Cardiocondyla obscurior TaxID=286306 RepID=A0AAW2EQ29_9HYME
MSPGLLDRWASVVPPLLPSFTRDPTAIERKCSDSLMISSARAIWLAGSRRFRAAVPSEALLSKDKLRFAFNEQSKIVFRYVQLLSAVIVDRADDRTILDKSRPFFRRQPRDLLFALGLARFSGQPPVLPALRRSHSLSERFESAFPLSRGGTRDLAIRGRLIKIYKTHERRIICTYMYIIIRKIYLLLIFHEETSYKIFRVLRDLGEGLVIEIAQQPRSKYRNLQYVTNNTYTPYVGTETNLIEVYDFRASCSGRILSRDRSR